ncbi:malate synthase G [Henriciella litoralis]|uniref:malate synthase G n=1 Tax=Henriciella litoralis TaxID=568102 RepID=UPI000A053879|nr:malate synthase G [Henriciella litoralis]
MTNYVDRGQLKIDAALADFVEREALKGLPYDSKTIWSGLEEIISHFSGRNRALLARREVLEDQIQDWQSQNAELARSGGAQKEFLSSIGYLLDEPADFEIQTSNTDVEIAEISGPQLVVPVSNARYALNAANARWGSLYDALYGTDAIMPPPEAGGYDPERGQKVIDWSKQFLDKTWPLAEGSHADVTQYWVEEGELAVAINGSITKLSTPEALVGFSGPSGTPESILLINNGLHAELQFDRNSNIGRDDRAGMKDIYLESALTTIIDFEDSVAAVDGEDKTACYRNWLGLMRGDLQARLTRGGAEIVRQLAPDREYTSAQGTSISRPGRSRLLVRNVGHLMTTPAVIDRDGEEVFEGLLDALLTSLMACHGLNNGTLQSVYIVKPKMHGPEEAAFANDVLETVEQILNLSPSTLKIGLMDEERRTSTNLKACVYELRNRIIFINTGFLDRTGDEIFTALEAGPVARKEEMKSSPWLGAYEMGNVQTGLGAGFRGKAQIGKGMWAKPDYMGEMLAQKANHPLAGADCAWVPSPTAATLHALHYHEIDVETVQADLLANSDPISSSERLIALLTPPIADPKNWTKEDIRTEVENCCQTTLGYVVRWIDQGVGCSKVPDIHDVGLMEDRATLRISCQLLGNWLHHGVVSRQDVEAALLQMAEIVDRQNSGDPAYTPMLPDHENNIAFQAARDLVFQATCQPSGYTEPILHRRRRDRKAQLAANEQN